MSKSTVQEKWIEAGYNLFANEGPEGIHVERLARMLQLNKSGFYHYSGDMENFSGHLIKHHHYLVGLFLRDVALCKNFDPEYLHVLIEHRITVMGQVYLVRNKTHPFYFEAHKLPDEKIGNTILKIWSSHVNIPNNPELALTYHALIRDVFYSRISLENFNYDYLHSIGNEAKEIVAKLQLPKQPIPKTLV